MENFLILHVHASMQQRCVFMCNKTTTELDSPTLRVDSLEVGEDSLVVGEDSLAVGEDRRQSRGIGLDIKII
jgi:hypothetical protein